MNKRLGWRTAGGQGGKSVVRVFREDPSKKLIFELSKKKGGSEPVNHKNRSGWRTPWLRGDRDYMDSEHDSGVSTECLKPSAAKAQSFQESPEHLRDTISRESSATQQMAIIQSLPPPTSLPDTRPMGPSADIAAISDTVTQQLL